MKISAVSLGALLMIAACTPASMETDPVTVETDQGPVTCQLYTRELVLWDKALSRPVDMTDEAANEICRGEGRRLRDAG